MLKMQYRLALDLGSTSIGWAMIRLNALQEPVAVIKAGCRIFSDGRHPKSGASLAVERREKRAMRRTRDRRLRRKARLIQGLVDFGFFPADKAGQKALVDKDPYELRARGLDQVITPAEFGRALFHMNQRRGFKSNRKYDGAVDADKDVGALKTAISTLRREIEASNMVTVGAWLHNRHKDEISVRARLRKTTVLTDTGKEKKVDQYDFYIDRAMIEHEFDCLWAAQAPHHPEVYTEEARQYLRSTLLFQRNLRPVSAGRCTLIPNEQRAALALPSQQRFRIYQELNNLRYSGDSLEAIALTLEQRDTLAATLETKPKLTFEQIRRALKISVTFTHEGSNRDALKGNTTGILLSKKEYYGAQWASFSDEQQDAIVTQLLNEPSSEQLTNWLVEETGITNDVARKISGVRLVADYGKLSAAAVTAILPYLKSQVITYDKAVLAAGFEHHSRLADEHTGEILPCLPYYGEYLQRHVGFVSVEDAQNENPEKRFGKIANPTVHIGLNQIRVVVNALIKRYGHPAEVVVEVARDLKQSQEMKYEETKRQGERKTRNERMREQIAPLVGCTLERVKLADLQKMILWEELSQNAADRRCPYSGRQISAAMLFSPEVEIEHILPFSATLDDTLNNKTVAIKQANRIKGNRTPAEAAADFARQGWVYDDILVRAQQMPPYKRYRFAADGYERWLAQDSHFLARALNDTKYLSVVAQTYLRLICPGKTRAIPGRLTALLRANFGLNGILGLKGEKNRDDHRHHAVDACVIGVTDTRMLQRVSAASASARERNLQRTIENMPLPWDGYYDHVKRAVERIKVSHKPNHSHEGRMMEDSAWGLVGDSQTRRYERDENGRRHRTPPTNRSRIRISSSNDPLRHTPPGSAYKGYVGGSNHSYEIFKDEKGAWALQLVSTYQAYQIVRDIGAVLASSRLQSPWQTTSGQPLVMRLHKNDTVRMNVDGRVVLMRVLKFGSNGQIFFVPVNEANAASRSASKDDSFSVLSKYPGTLQRANAQAVTISPIGIVRRKRHR